MIGAVRMERLQFFRRRGQGSFVPARNDEACTEPGESRRDVAADPFMASRDDDLLPVQFGEIVHGFLPPLFLISCIR
jgi:hypothetical protein